MLPGIEANRWGDQSPRLSVYVGDFNPKSHFQAAWMKLYNNDLGIAAKDTFAAELKQKMQHMLHNVPERALTLQPK